PEPSRGRRGNGLPAGEWGALVDVDPRLSDQLLERLAAEGVAAHVEPAGATTDPVSRAGTMPVRPLERLWVDVARADAARAVVEAAADEVVQALPGAGGIEQFLHAVPRGASGRVLKPPPRLDRTSPAPVPASDDDAAWRAIVEGYERSPDQPVPPWPVEEDVDASRPADEPTAPPEPPRRRRTDPPAADLPGWVEPAALPDDGRYVPPPPPPPPRIAPRTLAAVASIVLGVLLLFAPSLLDVAAGSGSYLLGMLLTAGGAGALVYWMRDAPGPDDGPDDGAVV
ncbi:MAG TPA: hypothetical protein VNU26_05240, partial [Mycobacteriales bacterium]|nr:hypothetical protein [Mycobacteriales bacterium]